MRSHLAPAALLALALAASPSPAQCGHPIFIPQAPSACGPGFGVVSQYGVLYAPNYFLRPDFLPFQGMVPVSTGPTKKGGPPGMAQGPGGYPGMAQGPGGYPGMQGGHPGPGGNLPGFAPLPGLQPNLQNQPPLSGLQPNLQNQPPLSGLPGVPPMPPMARYQGIPGQAGPPRFLSHPFARSPRDFFMLD